MKIIYSLHWVFIVLVCVIGGCGGGTTGSGGGSVVQLSGSLSSPSGQPLAGVMVEGSRITQAFADMAKSAVTDASGRFDLAVEVEFNARPELSFQGAGVNGSYTLPSLPQGTAKVTLDLEYDAPKAEVRKKSAKYEDDEGNELPEESGEKDDDKRERDISNDDSEDSPAVTPSPTPSSTPNPTPTPQVEPGEDRHDDEDEDSDDVEDPDEEDEHVPEAEPDEPPEPEDREIEDDDNHESEDSEDGPGDHH